MAPVVVADARPLELDPASVYAVVLTLFADPTLLQAVRRLFKTEPSKVWELSREALAQQAGRAESIGSIEVRCCLLEGLAGESLLVSSSLFLT
jgi:hypothetical protein